MLLQQLIYLKYDFNSTNIIIILKCSLNKYYVINFIVKIQQFNKYKLNYFKIKQIKLIVNYIL